MMVDYCKYSDEDLMREIKADNMFAFDTLYKRYFKRLYKFAYLILKTHEDTENIIQDVFLNLWLNRHKVEKGSSVKYYIFTIAYNSAVSLIRIRIKESQFVEYVKSLQFVNQEQTDKDMEYQERTERLYKIIDTLPERQKEIYLLHGVEGLKYTEISEQLNISIKTVENHISRAIKTIRKRLNNYSLITIFFVVPFYLRSTL